MEGRIHRIGQENKCTYIDFVVKDDIDEDVKEALDIKKRYKMSDKSKRVILKTIEDMLS